jgi:hypothetical protein
VAEEDLGDLTVDVTDGALDALPAVTLAAVAQLDRLVFTGGRPARDGRPPSRPAHQEHLDLDGGVAAGVEHLATLDVDDLAHWCTMASGNIQGGRRAAHQ